MSNYRKLVAYIIGAIAIILGPTVLGVTPGEELFGIGQETAVEIIVGLLTGLGVWGFANTPSA